MGLDINVHDQWAVESMGRVQDRTHERLGVSDRAVTANRRLLLRAIDAFTDGGRCPARPADEAAAARADRPARRGHDRADRRLGARTGAQRGRAPSGVPVGRPS